MMPPFKMWQQHPILFATGLWVLTTFGLVLMLGDEGIWKGVGFLCTTAPFVQAVVGYINGRKTYR
ncbi:hypothetical protein AFCDBAGC_0095 [Methylobacterium cerastii]|uniref:Uncharacterized protein n=1 Tax=Methylobacterium cerastii TaxID=932741 RepID=A0ABQ4QBQ5_9HYPH|nr:hypothetical protein [Methylobacterium cerastii]GJD42260.1 hypothetical protein AFCDBAGC_0095 [Methylobacterium cerastii]